MAAGPLDIFQYHSPAVRILARALFTPKRRRYLLPKAEQRAIRQDRKAAEQRQLREARELLTRLQFAARAGKLSRKTTELFWKTRRAVKAHDEKMCLGALRKYRRFREAFPDWADRDAIVAIYAECRRLNAKAGYIAYHVDHIIPVLGVRVSGLHVADNLQILPAKENRQKYNKFIAG